jgi:hypothetical protein
MANARRLLNGVTEIIKGYEAEWQKTGEKYNLFKVARIAYKEVIMCRVLADLLDPKGAHGRGSLYLKLFWETITPKLPGRPELDFAHTKATTESVTDKSRRIDIALENGKVFAPIEVKIQAGDQPDQIADYFEFAKTKNRGGPIPVLYLTLDGHDSADAKKLEGKYVKLSFKDDILAWLDACARENENTPETTIPVRENLKQLIAAVKSLCGRSEDVKMENEIFKRITKDDDSIRTALAISGVVDLLDQKVKEAFKGPITDLVKKSLPKYDAEYEDEDDWHCIDVPIRQGKYNLYINYDWKYIHLGEPSGDAKTEKALAEKMSELTGDSGTSYGTYLWVNKKEIAYPALSSADKRLYLYELYKLYSEKPQEAVDRIVSIVRALESVKA